MTVLRSVLRKVRTVSCGASTGTAHVDGSEGSDNYIRPSFLPTVVQYADRPLIHSNDNGRALCGAPVLGVTGDFGGVECVVCAELLEGRKTN